MNTKTIYRWGVGLATAGAISSLFYKVFWAIWQYLPPDSISLTILSCPLAAIRILYTMILLPLLLGILLKQTDWFTPVGRFQQKTTLAVKIALWGLLANYFFYLLSLPLASIYLVFGRAVLPVYSLLNHLFLHWGIVLLGWVILALFMRWPERQDLLLWRIIAWSGAFSAGSTRLVFLIHQCFPQVKLREVIWFNDLSIIALWCSDILSPWSLPVMFTLFAILFYRQYQRHSTAAGQKSDPVLP